jgi:hypothetical protein
MHDQSVPPLTTARSSTDVRRKKLYVGYNALHGFRFKRELIRHSA